MSTKPGTCLVGVVDLGTSSGRFSVIDCHNGETVAFHQAELQQLFPQEGWVEQDPEEYVNCIEKCIKECCALLSTKNISASKIKGVGITNQRETVIAWDKQTGKPLYNAIVWLDNRTEAIVNDLSSKNGKNSLVKLCGLPLSTYFTAPKIVWLKKNVPAVRQAMHDKRCLVGTVDSWLLWKFTSGKCHMTDVTNASRTMLMNITSRKWDDTLLAFFDIPAHVLPEIRSSSETYGTFSDDFFLVNVPICGILGDQQASLVGHMCFSSGQLKNTFGTGNFIMVNTGPQPILNSELGLLTTVGYQFGGKNGPVAYALEGSLAVAGQVVRWLRDNMNFIKSAPEIEALANSVPTSGGVIFIPAFTGLLCPYFRPDAKALITGMTLSTTKAHIARAALEAVAMQSSQVVEMIGRAMASEPKPMAVDGGMSRNGLLMKMLADYSNVPVNRCKIEEVTSYGAALAAAAAIGVWKPPIADMPQPPADTVTYPMKVLKYDSFKPTMSAIERLEKCRDYDVAIERCLLRGETRSRGSLSTQLSKDA